MNFKSADERLGSRSTRKVANHTYLQRRDKDTIAVKLHETDIVIFKSNGDTILDHGGWRTLTTRDRMNRSIPFGRIVPYRGAWYFCTQLDTPRFNLKKCFTEHWNSAAYKNRMVLHPDGSTSGGYDE